MGKLGLVLLGVLIGGCDTCHVVIRSRYTGNATGVHYVRNIVPDGTVTAATKGEVMSGPPPEVKLLDGCPDQLAMADVPGWHVQAWVDTDGDDAASCTWDGRPQVGILDTKACGPDPKEPQIDQAYTMHSSGVTEVSVVLGD